MEDLDGELCSFVDTFRERFDRIKYNNYYQYMRAAFGHLYVARGGLRSKFITDIILQNNFECWCSDPGTPEEITNLVKLFLIPLPTEVAPGSWWYLDDKLHGTAEDRSMILELPFELLTEIIELVLIVDRYNLSLVNRLFRKECMKRTVIIDCFQTLEQVCRNNDRLSLVMGWRQRLTYSELKIDIYQEEALKVAIACGNREIIALLIKKYPKYINIYIKKLYLMVNDHLIEQLREVGLEVDDTRVSEGSPLLASKGVTEGLYLGIHPQTVTKLALFILLTSPKF